MGPVPDATVNFHPKVPQDPRQQRPPPFSSPHTHPSEPQESPRHLTEPILPQAPAYGCRHVVQREPPKLLQTKV